MITIRGEQPEDVPAIRVINERAFNQPLEADLVDALRRGCPDFVSLVAVEDGKLIGHVLFTPATIDSNGVVVTGMGLAPVAVLPEFQKRGVGSRLIEEGLRMLRARRCPFVIVLGHPDYYPRFGFERASKFGLRPQWVGVSDEAFMALILDADAMCGVTGVTRYREEFDMAI